jgi:hypothetical protein
MTTTQDSEEYINTEYKRLYKTLLHNYKILKTKCTSLVNKNMLLQARLKKPKRNNIQTDYDIVKDIINEYMQIDIDVKVRLMKVVSGRNMYYKWMRQNTKLAYKSISITLECNHDHSTIIHSINTHDADYEFSKTYKKTYDTIVNLINERLKETTSRN